MAQPPPQTDGPQPTKQYLVGGGLNPAVSPWYRTRRQQDLKGKTAVVTGSSRGIGRAIAFQLASRGCQLLIMCSKESNMHLLESFIREIRMQPWIEQGSPKIVPLAADILDSGTPVMIVQQLRQHFGGYLDIFVNNACIASAAEMGLLTEQHIRENVKGNIEFPVKAVEAFVREEMFRPASRIICISSVRARKAWANQIMYMASKSANEAMCRSWADAFGGKHKQYAFMAGTTANTVMAGITQTDSVFANPNVPPDVVDKFVQEFVPEQAIPRVGTPEDVADVVGLLCREESRWITGSVVGADGGGISIL